MARIMASTIHISAIRTGEDLAMSSTSTVIGTVAEL